MTGERIRLLDVGHAPVHSHLIGARAQSDESRWPTPPPPSGLRRRTSMDVVGHYRSAIIAWAAVLLMAYGPPRIVREETLSATMRSIPVLPASERNAARY